MKKGDKLTRKQKKYDVCIDMQASHLTDFNLLSVLHSWVNYKLTLQEGPQNEKKYSRGYVVCTITSSYEKHYYDYEWESHVFRCKQMNYCTND